MDVSKFKEGKFKCEKEDTWKFANSTEAENCYRYCERFRKDMYLGDEAVKVSSDYLKSHEGYSAVGCYITTIVVNILGMADNCEELMVLRVFRKNYMQRNPQCKDLLVKYDALGPVIARVLSCLPNREEVAKNLYDVYIKGAVKYIKSGKYDDAIKLYSEMMNNLISLHINGYLIPDKVYETYDMDKAGHGKITIK
jgi:hypothetical protein